MTTTPLPTELHRCRGYSGQPCIHLVGEMPHAVTVARGPVLRLNFQPRIMVEPQPVIAARRGAVLFLFVDKVGPATVCSDAPLLAVARNDRRLGYRWWFQLTETGEPGELLATQFDATGDDE
jgi:hypothetical protein